jgi:phenylpyruvate tautomerase PptA (4-oxalocrotonate tautomerase family)
MKSVIEILILSTSVYMANAQTTVSQNLKKSVSDDGKTLQVFVKGYYNQNPVYYNKRYNVAGWSQTQKDALVKRITDSLGIASSPTAPKLPATPASGSRTHVESEINDENGLLHIQLRGTDPNNIFNYDRSFDVKGMSRQQKNAIIKHVADSLGIGQSTQLTGN